MSKKELVKNIKKEIKNHGFPLEIFVIDICSKKNIGRLPNLRYNYNSELKEIDLYAFFEEIKFDSKNNPQHTFSNLIIECKKSKEHPWIFFSSDMYKKSGSLLFLKNISTYDKYFLKRKQHSLFGQIWKYIKKNHYLRKNIPKCISYFEAFGSPRKNSQIYDAINSVLSFMKYEIENWVKREKGEYDAVTRLYYPIIVLDGDLFEAKIKNDKIILKERNHLQLRTRFDEEVFIIDVVKKGYFETFLDIIEVNHNEIVDAISKLKLTQELKTKILGKHKAGIKKDTLPLPLECYYTKIRIKK